MRVSGGEHAFGALDVDHTPVGVGALCAVRAVEHEVAAVHRAIEILGRQQIAGHHLDAEPRDARGVGEIAHERAHARTFFPNEAFDESSADEPRGAGHQHAHAAQAAHWTASIRVCDSGAPEPASHG